MPAIDVFPAKPFHGFLPRYNVVSVKPELRRHDRLFGAVISGGTLDINSGGSISTAATTFATSGGGTLLLESSLTFSGLVAGFGQPDRLDLPRHRIHIGRDERDLDPERCARHARGHG